MSNYSYTHPSVVGRRPIHTSSGTGSLSGVASLAEDQLEEEEGVGLVDRDRRSRGAASSIITEEAGEGGGGGEGELPRGLEGLSSLGLGLNERGKGNGSGLRIDTRYIEAVEAVILEEEYQQQQQQQQEQQGGESEPLPVLPTPSPVSSAGRGEQDFRLSSSCEDVHVTGSGDDA